MVRLLPLPGLFIPKKDEPMDVAASNATPPPVIFIAISDDGGDGCTGSNMSFL